MSRPLLAALFIVTLGGVTCASARETWVGLNLRAQVAYVEMNKLNTVNLGGGAEASFFPHKRLLLEGRYSKSYFANGNADDYESYYEAPASPEIKPFTYWEAGAQINLIVRSGEYENSTNRDYSSTTTYDPVTGTGTTTTRWTKYSWLASEYQLYGIRGGVLGLESGMAADLGKEDDVILD